MVEEDVGAVICISSTGDLDLDSSEVAVAFVRRLLNELEAVGALFMFGSDFGSWAFSQLAILEMIKDLEGEGELVV